jgi:hypothetical protein
MVNRQPIRHPRRTSLTHAQRMWLLYGYDQRWDDAFASEAAYVNAWAHHREELLQGCSPGRRPVAWWILEGGGRHPGYSLERQVMFEQNLFGAEEREALLRIWREDFERGFRWSDGPAGLWAEWEAQRRDEKAAEQPVPAA